MAQKGEHSPEAIRAKVEQVLKATIDSELARASSPHILREDGTPFSRGLVFSKTNPFSRGIFFSKTSDIERPEELEREVVMDPVILSALAERLIQVRAVKDLKGDFGVRGFDIHES
jgi:hypothetical protein